MKLSFNLNCVDWIPNLKSDTFSTMLSGAGWYRQEAAHRPSLPHPLPACWQLGLLPVFSSILSCNSTKAQASLRTSPPKSPGPDRCRGQAPNSGRGGVSPTASTTQAAVTISAVWAAARGRGETYRCVRGRENNPDLSSRSHLNMASPRRDCGLL